MVIWPFEVRVATAIGGSSSPYIIVRNANYVKDETGERAHCPPNPAMRRRLYASRQFAEARDQMRGSRFSARQERVVTTTGCALQPVVLWTRQFSQSEPAFKNSFHVPMAVKDGDHLQGFRLWPVDDEIGIGWEELDRLVRQAVCARPVLFFAPFASP
jgi:hypothetical protein